MCGCTSKDPTLCACGHGAFCTCYCHRNWSPVPIRGPKQALDEKQAEIKRLRHQITVKDAALHVARDWITFHMERYHLVGGEEELNTALQMALDCK